MRTQSFETVAWEYDEETNVGRIVLDRPESLNALSEQLKDDIVAGFDAFGVLDDESPGVEVRCVVLEGAGDAFSAGADITEFDETFAGYLDLHDAWTVPETFGAPVVAKIDGYCFGGGLELALACDFRLASADSEFGLPEVDLGLLPGAGGTQRLTQLVGPSRAKYLTMLGDTVSAQRAASEGIVDEVHPRDALDEEVAAFAERLASQPPLAIRALKDVINYAQEVGLREGRLYEHRAEMSLHESADAAEGIRAFLEDGYEATFRGQ